MTAPAPERVDLPVSGMTCAACARAIERTLSATAGVERASVNLATNTATVEYDAARTGVSDFIGAIEDLGYGVPETEPLPDAGETLYRSRLIVAILFAVPVVALGMAHIAPWIQLALTLPVIFYSGAPFYRAGWRALRHASANMNTLISLGTGAAFLYSVYETVRGGHMVYYEAAATIIALILLGRTLEARARAKASEAIRRMMDLQPPTARVLRNGAEVETPVANVRPGDTVVVRPGDRVPVDGTVSDGESAVDESMLTGESMPVDKRPGASVFAGTVNRSGSFRYEVKKVGRGTVLQQMIALVKQAQGSRAPVARLADVVSGYFTMGVLIAALITFGAWLFFAHGPENSRFATAMENAVAVLIIACPCALGLATPTAIMVGTGRGAEHGILIKGGEALEMAHKIGVVVLDKTGTITRGKPKVVRIVPAAGWNETDLLRLAASAERYSEHPLGRAIVEAATERGVALEDALDFAALTGLGVRARVTGRDVTVAKPGATVTVDGALAGEIEIADTIKPEAAEAVKRLRRMGLEVWMITGDHRTAADAVAREAGIDNVLAEVMPADKVAAVRKLQAAGKRVAMVGDGVNDAPVLAAADLGLAVGSGTDAAINAADLILLRDDLTVVASAIALARRTLRTIKGNLTWAFLYNLAAIPLAAFGLLDPLIAGGAMALSSAFVVWNSSRLRSGFRTG
jgi:Cu+-exporting ATPase